MIRMPIQRITLSLLLMLVCVAAGAQHVIKIAPIKLTSGNLAVSYEHVLTNRLSVNINTDLGFRRNLVNSAFFETFYVQADTSLAAGVVDIESLRTGNIKFNPELRIYASGEAPNGFYFGPFLRYARYRASSELTYTKNTDVSSIDGRGIFSLTGGGLVLGAQWVLADKFAIDWTILGVGFGAGRVSLDGDVQGSIQDEVQPFIDDLNASLETLPLVNIQLENNGSALDARTNMIPMPLLYSRLSFGIVF
ncbi:MAG: hypothetical protein OHK0039_34990 [Bacteroidia bacterium]